MRVFVSTILVAAFLAGATANPALATDNARTSEANCESLWNVIHETRADMIDLQGCVTTECLLAFNRLIIRLAKAEGLWDEANCDAYRPLPPFDGVGKVRPLDRDGALRDGARVDTRDLRAEIRDLLVETKTLTP